MLGVVALPGKVATPRDLVNKTIAVNTLDNVGTLTIASALRASDVQADAVKFKEVPFPSMAAALSSGQVDAAWLVEPFITNTAKNLGARMVLDTASGPTADLPVAGYVTTATFAQNNSKTAAAFKRAIRRAQQLCADRQNVEKVLPQFTQIDPETAVITGVGVYPGLAGAEPGTAAAGRRPHAEIRDAGRPPRREEPDRGALGAGQER